MTRRSSIASLALACFLAGFVLAPPLHISFHGHAHTHGGAEHYHAEVERAFDREEARSSGSPDHSDRRDREPFDPEHGKGSVIHSSIAGTAAIEPLAALSALEIALGELAAPAPLLQERRSAGRAHLVRGPPSFA